MSWNDYLREVLDWVSNQNDILVWLFFFLSNLLENVFPPWPGDAVTVFGGFFVAKTEGISKGFGIWGLWSSTVLGNIAGGWIMYIFGHRFLNIIRYMDFPFKKDFYSEEMIESTFRWFRKNAIVVVVLSRFSAGIRFFVSIVAGMVQMNIFIFTGLFTVAVFLWCGMLIYGGYSIGQNWEIILEYLDIYSRVIGSFFLVLIFGLLFHFIFIRKNQNKKQ